ncbi:MAG: hypothetical protein GXO84_10720, partial [Chlorobi bacterium]|nr:hypothetical protein [Chlorobiota bacterium]
MTLSAQNSFIKEYAFGNYGKANYVLQSSDGGYLMAGSTKPVSLPYSNYYLVKTDEEHRSRPDLFH